MSPTVVQAREGQQRNSLAVSQTKGLLNAPGQNNCFLNSAVQVLWHLDIFRRSFRELGGHACMEDSCIFCALKELFAQFQYSRESALPPDALRRALAETFFNQQRFQLGFMDDAAECFENILLRIHFHIANAESEDMCNATHCIPHQKFAMTLVEQSICHACGATSEPLPFTQMVHYVSASAMCMQAKQLWKEGSQIGTEFGQLLRRAGGMGDIRDCPSSCGAEIQICRSLMNRPEIVSVGIVWDSEHPTLEHIMNVFRVIGTSVRLPDVFHSVVDRQWASTTVHHLVGVVTYYGKHYSTFFFHTKLHVWIYFDDATVREIGPRWEQVVEKCHRGHFQPLLLLYANPQGVPISLETAPQNITYVTGQGKAKEELPKQEVPKAVNYCDRSRFYLNGHAAIQRRAVTPNPESARELMKEACQRRAITPNPETFISGDVPRLSSKVVSQPQPLPNRTNEDKIYTDSYGHSKLQYPVNLKIPHHINANAEMPVDEVDNAKQLVESPNDPFQTDIKQAEKSNMYISRKAVENVLNYQKLQRQRSLSTGNYSSIGNRNSNSSLESFDNTLRPRSGFSGSPPDVKSDLTDLAGLGRRRDSGNWSGDRNSASSGSSLSLETPHFYAAMKQPCPPGYRQHPPKPVEIMTNPMYDPGYDSYSLSSNDSYPLSPQTKHNQQLAQIPEIPVRDYYDNNYIHLHKKDAIDECVKLCVEADQYLEKSRGLEDTGDFSGAVSLCNSAAAKARAAMDAPYTNPQSLMFARMKHNTCVMRARSLHRRFLMRQESINSHGSTTSTETDSGDGSLGEKPHQGNHSRQASSDSQKRKDSHSRQNSKDGSINHSRQNSRESRQSSKEFTCHSRQGSKDSTKKGSINIEIYATLPKKLGKKKLEKISTGSIRSKDEKYILQSASQTTLPSELIKQEPINGEKNLREAMYKEKKKDSVKSDRDTEFSDYSSEWEMTKKSKLHRTYSSPPIRTTSLAGSQPNLDLKDKPDTSKPNTQPGKKQHKIRRKLLMGGLIRRKNRSMPDLREGQDGADPLQSQHSFDDLQLNQGDTVKRNLTGYLSDAHLDYVQSDGIEKSHYNKIHYGSCRQLSQLHNKLPPQPPVRTTSQLTLNTTPHPQHPKPVVLSKVENPHNPGNTLIQGMPLIRNSSLIVHNQNKPIPALHQGLVHNRKLSSPYMTQPLIHSSHAIPQHPACAAKAETRIDMTPDGTVSDASSQYCNYSIQKPISPNPETPDPTKCNNFGSSNYAQLKASMNSTSTKDTMIQEVHDRTADNLQESNGLLQELQIKRQQILHRKAQEETATSKERSVISNTEENTTMPAKQMKGWLEELQVKQCQMLQRRSLEPHQTADHSISLKTEEKPTIRRQPAALSQNHPVRKQPHIPPPLELNRPQQSPVESDSIHQPCSVKDLASRFEQIVSPTSPKPPVAFPGACQETYRSGFTSPSHENQRSCLPSSFCESIKSSTDNLLQAASHETKLLPAPLLPTSEVPSRMGTKKEPDQPSRPPQLEPKPVPSIPATAYQQDIAIPANATIAPPSLPSNRMMNSQDSQPKLVYEAKPISPYQVLPAQAPCYVKPPGPPKPNYESQNPPLLPSRGSAVSSQQQSVIQHDRTKMINSGLRPPGREGHQPPPYHAAISALHRSPGALNHGLLHQVPSQPPNHAVPVNSSEMARETGGCFMDVVSTNYINQFYPGKPYAAVQPARNVGQRENYQYAVKQPSVDADKSKDFHTMQINSVKELMINNNSAVSECDGVIKQPCNNKVIKVPIQVTGEINTESACVLQSQTVHQHSESQAGNKKKTKPKKSVTFSDQIALVASADDQPEEFLPNPLLQRVYKTLVHHKSPSAQDQKDKGTVHVVKQRTAASEAKKPVVSETVTNSDPPVSELPAATKVSSAAPKVPCHLCRKKYVIPPVVYCPDCDFYMSRFKPKS